MSISLQSRYAEICDAAALARVYSETWRATYQGIFPHDYLQHMIARRDASWWEKNLMRATTTPPLVFEHDGDVRGYINFGQSRYGRTGFEGEIYELNIRPAYQGLGFGGALFDAARAALDEQALHGLVAWSLGVNERACAFLEHKGGKPVGRAPVRFGAMGWTREFNRIAYGWEPPGGAHPLER